MLVSIKYDLDLKTDDLFTNPKNIRAKVVVTWLFRILKIKFVYINSKTKLQIYLFGFCINKKRRRKKPKIQEAEITIATEDEVFEQSESQKAEESIEYSEPAEIQEEAKQIKKEKIKAKKEKKEKKIKTPKEKGEGGGFRDIIEKIKYVYYYPDRKKITRNFFNMIKRILNHLKPRHFDLDIILGLDDPATTGNIVGYAAIASGIMHKDVFLKGSFLEKIAIVAVDMKGRIRIGSIFWPAIRFVFSIPMIKVIYKFIKYYFKNKKSEN